MAIDLVITLEADALGMRFDHAKDVAGPEVVVLGAKLSSVTLTLTIADKKRRAYHTFVSEFLEEHKDEATCTRKWLERLRGRLGFCAQLSRWASVFLPELDAAMYPPGWKGTPPQTCQISEALRADLNEFWLVFLGTKEAPWLVRSQWSTLPTHRAIEHEHYVSVSDASGHWGAGGVTLWENFARRWGQREMPLHINIKELIAASDTAIARMPQYANGRLVMECDNTGAVRYINKGSAGLPEARHVLRSLAAAALKYNVEVRARHRPGKAMDALGADPNSRGRGPADIKHLPAVAKLDRQAVEAEGPVVERRMERPGKEKAESSAVAGDGPPDVEEWVEAWRRVAGTTVHMAKPESTPARAEERVRFRGIRVNMPPRVERRPKPAVRRDNPLPTGGTPTIRRRMARPGKEKAESSAVAGDGPARTRQPAGGATRAAAGQGGRRCGGCRKPVQKSGGMQCARCRSAWHIQCTGTGRSAAAWVCGQCLQRDTITGRRWDLTKVAALLAAAQADGTGATYCASVRRFVCEVQEAPGGEGLSWDDIIPAEPDEQVREDDVLVFIAESVHKYATSTVEGTLAAITDLHKRRSGGKASGPCGSYRVRQAMRGLRHRHRATVKGSAQAAFAMPPALVREVIKAALCMAKEARKRGDHRREYGHTRDALWYAVAYMACLRKSEAIRVHGSDFSAGVVAGTLHLFIAYSKNDPDGVGVTLPLALGTFSGIDLGEALEQHRRVMRKLGLDVDGPLFGDMAKPGRRLGSADPILRRLRRVYFPYMQRQGMAVIDDTVRFSGHSFRRGGINGIRDGARRDGLEDAALRTLLMRFGRWRDERSLLLYLKDNWTSLAALTARI